MKKKELIPFIKDYDDLFPSFWSRDKTTFLRLEGDWVQYVDFRTGSFLDDYVPVHAMSYLKDVGSASLIGSFFVDDLHNPHSAYEKSPWKIRSMEHPFIYKEVYREMCKQFIPHIERSINERMIWKLLKAECELIQQREGGARNDLYALTLIELERENIKDAQRLLNVYRNVFLGVKAREWYEQIQKEVGKSNKFTMQDSVSFHAYQRLVRYFNLAQNDPSQLRNELDAIRKTNIANLTAKRTSEPRLARLNTDIEKA